MNTWLFLHRHRPINMLLALAIVIFTVWLIVIFAAAPESQHSAFGMTKQELKLLRYSQAD